VPAAGRLLIYFCELLPSVILLVFLLVFTAIGNNNCCKFNSLCD
jgi:hypothetical protein